MYIDVIYKSTFYVRHSEGAQHLLLDAGDYCLYRNSLWHTGNYVPYKKRATLHDSPMTEEFHEWRQAASEKARQRIEQGIEWENPNTDRAAQLVG